MSLAIPFGIAPTNRHTGSANDKSLAPRALMPQHATPPEDAHWHRTSETGWLSTIGSW
jgi:hypothetical protein